MIVRPYLADKGAKKTWEPNKVLDMFTYEKIPELEFYSNCFNESLRM